jgi:hypothetical protein
MKGEGHEESWVGITLQRDPNPDSFMIFTLHGVL